MTATVQDRGRRPTETVVETEKTIAREELERHPGSGSASQSGDSTPGNAASDRELPIPDFNELSVRGAKVRLDELNAEELRRLRAYEAANKQRKTLIHEIDRRLRE